MLSQEIVEKINKQKKIKLDNKCNKDAIINRIKDVDLIYRYFRNNKSYIKKSNNHEGVICIGYRILSNNKLGCTFIFSVSFCSPKDKFNKFKAKDKISERFNAGERIVIDIDFGNIKEFDTIIKAIWNSHRLDPTQLGLKFGFKSWMKYIR